LNHGSFLFSFDIDIQIPPLVVKSTAGDSCTWRKVLTLVPNFTLVLPSGEETAVAPRNYPFKDNSLVVMCLFGESWILTLQSSFVTSAVIFKSK
jgi:hypothetical protein